MKIEILTFCDFAQENQGKLTIVGTFDTIIAPKFPCFHASLWLVLRMRFDIWEFGPHEFRIETHDLNGETQMNPISGKIDVNGAGNATAVSHLVLGVGNLQFKAPGVVNFVIYIDNKELSTVPLYLREVGQQQIGIVPQGNK
jgi:hypothetical protein